MPLSAEGAMRLGTPADAQLHRLPSTGVPYWQGMWICTAEHAR